MKFRYVFLLIFLSFFINYSVAYADDDIPRATYTELRDIYNQYDVPASVRFDRDYLHMIVVYDSWQNSIKFFGSDSVNFHLTEITGTMGRSYAGYIDAIFCREIVLSNGNTYDWVLNNNGNPVIVSLGSSGNYGSSFPKIDSSNEFFYTKSDIYKLHGDDLTLFYHPQRPILYLTFRPISMGYLGDFLMPLLPLVLGLIISYLALRKALKFLSRILSQA